MIRKLQMYTLSPVGDHEKTWWNQTFGAITVSDSLRPINNIISPFLPHGTEWTLNDWEEDWEEKLNSKLPTRPISTENSRYICFADERERRKLFRFIRWILKPKIAWWTSNKYKIQCTMRLRESVSVFNTKGLIAKSTVEFVFQLDVHVNKYQSIEVVFCVYPGNVFVDLCSV